MAIKFLAIFDDTGLPSAVPYYRQFPREPSPAGNMEIKAAAIVQVRNITLGSLLDQMARVAAGGVVMVVCHGVSTGLLIPVAKDGAFAERDALEVILTLGEVDAEAAQVRKMPSRKDDEKKAKIAAWKAFFQRRKIVEVQGEITLDEAEKAYRAWFENESQRLRITSATMRALMAKMAAVQAKNFERVEIRACAAGKSDDTMKTLKRFFGCSKLLAPMATTFYLSPVFVDSVSAWPNIVRFDPANLQRLRPGTRLPGPLGQMSPDDLRKTGEQRVFLKGGAAFVLKIWETSAFHFAAVGAAGRPLARAGTRQARSLDPDWTHVQAFVRLFILPTSTYRSGAFRVAGFWKPQDKPKKGQTPLPWVLPNEPEYITAIKQL